MKMKWETIENLEVLTRRESDSGKTAIVLFHGYGADAHDLSTLAEVLDPEEKADWFFPEGPLPTPWGGQSWFPIDMVALQRAMQQGTTRDLSIVRPPGIDNALELGKELIESLSKNYEKMIWGGFSQGAMLATDILLNTDVKCEFLFLYSGTLVNEDIWKEKALTKSGQRFLQTHGETDTVLGIDHAKKLYKMVTESKWKGDFIKFPGGHEIPPPVLERSIQILRTLIS